MSTDPDWEGHQPTAVAPRQVQHGATALRLQCLRTGPVGGVEVECLTYSPEVPRLIAEAGLVVSHNPRRASHGFSKMVEIVHRVAQPLTLDHGACRKDNGRHSMWRLMI